MARVKPDISPSDRLRVAACKGDLRTVKDLLDQGISSGKDKDGRTLLHIAAQNGHVDVVKTLMARGFDTRAQDALGYTPLHRASAQGHLEVIEFLVKNGCPIDQQDECGNTALHAAAWNGYSQTLDLLLRNKARVNTINKAGFTALHSAAQKGHNQSARVLLFAGCQPNLKNKYGETALHTSAHYGHAGVARILLSAKCKVNVQNKNGETALHVSITCKRQKIAKLMIETGVKKKLKNKQGETALEIARKMNDLEMILVLTSEEKVPVMRRHRSEDIRQSSPADDAFSDAKSDSSGKRRDSQSRQEIDKENYQTLGSCAAGPAAAGAMATKTSCAAAPSNAISSSNRLLFNSNTKPEKLLEGFKQHQLEKQKKQTPDAVASTKDNKKEKMVKGMLSEYAPKPGQMYYRDLSGKVKQGPVGYAPVCEGGPALQQPERKNGAGHDELYEHITPANDLQKTKKCCHRRMSIQPVTEQGQATQGTNDCTTLSRLQKSAMPVEGRRSRVQSEPRLHSRSRSTNFENRFKGQPVQEEPCNCCRSNAAIETMVEGIGVIPGLDAYGFIQSGYPQDAGGHVEENCTPQGRLFRSRSDETLSTHSGRRRHHPSRQHQKMKAPNVNTSGDRYWTMSKATSRVREVDRENTYQTLHARQPKFSQAQNNHRPHMYHEESDYVLPSALLSDRAERSSRGLVVPDNTPRNQPLSSKLASTGRRKVGGTYQNSGEAFHGSGEQMDSSEIVVGSRRRLIRNDRPSGSKPGLPLSQSSPFVAKEELSMTASISQSGPCANPLPNGPCHPTTPTASPVCAAYPHENCCSLQSASSHPRADTGSNPDSGYGSKIYRTRGDLAVAFQPQDSNSSGKESRQSREDDKNSFGSSHWNTSECTVAPRHPIPAAVTKPNECRQTQPVRKTTPQRQQSLRDHARPFQLPSNQESLSPVSPQDLHHISSDNRVVAGRSSLERPASWYSQPPEQSHCSPNQTNNRQQAEGDDSHIHHSHVDNYGDRITGSMSHSSNNLRQPAKLSKRRERPASYQQREASVSRQNCRPDDRSMQQNDKVRRCDQSDKLKYNQPHSATSERNVCSLRLDNGQDTSQCSDFHMAQTNRLDAMEQFSKDLHQTESCQEHVRSSLELPSMLRVQPHTPKQQLNRGSRRQSTVEIGRSTMV